MPCVPRRAPEPIVDHRTVDIYGFDHVVGTIDIFVTYDLHRYVVSLVFLYVDSGYILVDILSQNSLQDHHALVAFPYLYYADVVHFSVAIEVEVVVELARVVECFLKLLEVLSLSKQVSYYF